MDVEHTLSWCTRTAFQNSRHVRSARRKPGIRRVTAPSLAPLSRRPGKGSGLSSASSAIIHYQRPIPLPGSVPRAVVPLREVRLVEVLGAEARAAAVPAVAGELIINYE